MTRDTAELGRRLAVFGLIAGPLLLALGTILDPAWEDEAAAYLSEVAANEGRYIAAGALATLGSLFFILGMLGLMRLLRRPGLSLGQVAAGMITFGLIGLTPILAFNGFDIVLADADNRDAAVAIFDQIEDTAPLIVYWMLFFIGGIVLGSLLLALDLFRRRIVPIWSPVLLIAAIVVGFVSASAPVAAASFVLLAAALAPLAMVIRGLSSAEWRRWEPYGGGADERVDTPPSPPPPR